MISARLAIVPAAVALLCGCSGSGIPPAQNYATVSGRAFDVATNAPVPGVAITLDVVLTATTGSDGSYRFTNVPVGQCHIYSITPPAGYAVQGAQPDCESVTAGQAVTVDIPLAHR